jgi:ribosomal protein S12 methylthiotransferase accessory factor
LKEARDYDISVAAYVNPVCGALGLQARHRLECTTTAPTIGHLAVRGDGYMHNSFWGGHAYNYDDSVVLGILEGLERHAGMRPRRVATAVVDTYENLAAEALDPAECGVYTDEFYAGNPYYVRYTPQLKIPWVWGYSLRDKRPLLVPENMTYYHVNRSLNKFLQECSNGCAVGSCIEEAIFFGLLELIERDAFVISWYGKASLPEIDPESCASTATRIMVDRIALYGYDVRLFDTRIEFPVPVVTAVGVRRNGGPGTLCVGAGTNLDPESAVRAALGEIANTIPGFDVHSARETDELREMAGDFDLVTALDDHPRLFGLPEMARHADFLLAGPAPRKPMDDIYRDWNQRRPRGQELLNDLQFCLDRVIAAGFDVIVVDQTSPEQMDAGVRGACVIVPGLIPVDFGWGRQRALHMPRLRSAFRRAGWRSTDLDDTELNRVPHPFP